MRRYFGTMLLMGATFMLLAACGALYAQPARQNTEPPRFDIAVAWQTTAANVVGAGSSFWMQGGSAQIHGRFYGGWGAVADISGAHKANINSSAVGLDMITVTFGPRYTWTPAHARYSIYGQGLVGEAWGMNGVFPNPSGANTVANSLAVKAGGGLNIHLAQHLALRAFEADYLRTQLPNSASNAQNNLLLGAGLVLRLN